MRNFFKQFCLWIAGIVRAFFYCFIQPWFFSFDNTSGSYQNRIKPIRVLITIFAFLVAASVLIKFDNPEWLSDMFVLGLFGQLGLLLGADTWRSNSKDKTMAGRMPDDNA